MSAAAGAGLAAVNTSAQKQNSPTNASANQKSTIVRVGNYELQKTLGKGNFAIVKLATNLVTNSKVAIKIIDKKSLDETNLAKTFREISVLKILQHPHITRLYEVIESRNMIYLVTEYAARGEIFDFLVANGKMKESEAARVFAQIVSAIDYCHSKSVVHRDLKLENVLLDSDMNVKLADFGFCNRFTPGTPLKTWCGSPPYAAPELFLGVEYDGPKADIWSLGVVLYALVVGGLPFDGGTLNELRTYVMGGKFRIPYFMSRECEHLIRNMLVVDPSRRFSVQQISRHKWIQMHAPNVEDSRPLVEAEPLLNNNIVSHMLQLPQMSADVIAQSVLEARFDRIYAVYHLLVDKLSMRRKEHARAAASFAARSRKTSITTGVVVREEFPPPESAERLSPLTNVSFDASPAVLDPPIEVTSDTSDMEISPPAAANMDFLFPTYGQPVNAHGGNGGTRRHTVGPGDVAHEQALAHEVGPINFKMGEAPFIPNIPTNLPALQNQPLNLLTIKDQHLLKPPVVMGNTVAFGRRASDGGANLHIYYPANVPVVAAQKQQMDVMYQRGGAARGPEGLISIDPAHQDVVMTGDAGDGSCDEIQRYIRGRGSSKRHTVGCTDDLSTPTPSGSNGSHSPAPSAGRVRKTGLLTVTERPPVISPDLIREVEARMNRNYLPPALKSSGGGQSPPHTSQGSASPTTTCSLRRYVHGGGRVSKLSPVPEVGRYSPVRRASEGSKINTPFQGALQECQQLQKATQRHLLNTQSPPLADNSVSLPGSPIHGKPFVNSCAAMMQEIEVPPDMILSITPGLERLVQDSHISLETAQQILQTHIVPLEIGKLLGLVAHSAGANIGYMQHSQSASPLAASGSAPKPPSMLPLNLASHHLPGSSSPIYYGGGSGCPSPNNASSPMHQITRGISGLSTGVGGSIVRGTSAASEPLDLSMDMNYEEYANGMWFPPTEDPGNDEMQRYFRGRPQGAYFNMQHPSVPQRIVVPTPPASPNLCIIQEEQNGSQNGATPVNSTPTAESVDYLHSHPQICLTDVQGSEITLVALSDSSRDADSDDSLEQRSATTSFQGLVITEPASDMPSITRGVGRKTSLENDVQRALETDVNEYARRGSDKSLGFSDDSLSNDSNLSPMQEPSGSSGFKSCDDSRLSPDSLSDRRLSDEYYELPLPYDCSHLESSRILEMIKRKIDSKMPPKGFTVNVPQGGGETTASEEASNLNIEYPSGLQVELQVTEGRSKENKGIKLRRVSGDQLEYGKLCQQLITSLTVV